jgi:hypothetical protein
MTRPNLPAQLVRFWRFPKLPLNRDRSRHPRQIARRNPHRDPDEMGPARSRGDPNAGDETPPADRWTQPPWRLPSSARRKVAAPGSGPLPGSGNATAPATSKTGPDQHRNQPGSGSGTNATTRKPPKPGSRPPLPHLDQPGRAIPLRGSVYKRCQCRDESGRRIKSCRKAHGSWAFTMDAGRDAVTGKRKQAWTRSPA